MTEVYGKLVRSHAPSQYGALSFSVVGAVIGGFLCLSVLPILSGVSEKLAKGESVYVDVIACVLLPVIGIAVLRLSRRDVTIRLDIYESGFVCHNRSRRWWGCSYTDVSKVKWTYSQGSFGKAGLVSLAVYFPDGTRKKVYPAFQDGMDAIDFIQRKLMPPDPLASTLPRFPGS